MSQKFDAIYDKPWKQINDCLMSLKAFLWAEVKAVYILDKIPTTITKSSFLEAPIRGLALSKQICEIS